MKYSKMIISTIALTCIASTPVFAAKNYYKWTDANGVTHYSAQRPNGTQSETVSIKGGGTTDNNSSDNNSESSAGTEDIKPAESTTEKDLAPSETAEIFEKDKKRCEMAKENLKTLKTAPRVRIKDDNGEFRFLSSDEISNQIEDSQKAIQESC